MDWFGKIAGGTVGFLFGGPPGAICGAAVRVAVQRLGITCFQRGNRARPGTRGREGAIFKPSVLWVVVDR